MNPIGKWTYNGSSLTQTLGEAQSITHHLVDVSADNLEIAALCQILLMKRLRRLFLGDVFWYLRILKQHNSADKLIVIAETVCHPLELFNFPNRALQSTI